MPLNYSIDKQRRLVLSIAEGCVTFTDVRNHQDRLLADPDFDASFDQLVDTTPATTVEISPAQVEILARRRMFSREARRAIVATKPHIFGLGRMFEIYAEGLDSADIEVF